MGRKRSDPSDTFFDMCQGPGAIPRRACDAGDRGFRGAGIARDRALGRAAGGEADGAGIVQQIEHGEGYRYAKRRVMHGRVAGECVGSWVGCQQAAITRVDISRPENWAFCVA